MSGSPDVSNWFVSPYSNSFVSHSGLWCPALRMSPIDFFPLIASHLSPIVTSGAWLSACFQFICLPLQQFICLPVWLVVSGAPDVSNWFVSPYSNWFVSQSGWWCPAHSYVCQSESGWWCPALRMSSPSCCQGFPVASIAYRLVV